MAAPIDLNSPLTLANALRFAQQSPAARREVLIGALWLLVPGVGWLLNMGHRIRLVHRLQRGEPPWPAWHDYGELLRLGSWTFLGMLWYGWPGLALLTLGLTQRAPMALGLGVVLGLAAVAAIPGYMSHYCVAFDRREIFDPRRALRRVHQSGWAYGRAWAIALAALALSFVGLLGLGVGFLWTSVWFWQTAAFGFAHVFSQTFGLGQRR